MTSTYVAKLALKLRITNINAQKIDGLALKTYDITLASFLLQDRLEKVRFFEETFSLANISIKMVPKKLFCFYSNTNF